MVSERRAHVSIESKATPHAEPPTAGGVGGAIALHCRGEAARHRPDAERSEQLSVHDCQLCADPLGLAAELFRAEPQDPVPEVVVEAGKPLTGHLVGRSFGRLAQLGQDEVDLACTGQEQEERRPVTIRIPAGGEWMKLPDEARQPRGEPWRPRTGDLKVPVRERRRVAARTRSHQLDPLDGRVEEKGGRHDLAQLQHDGLSLPRGASRIGGRMAGTIMIVEDEPAVARGVQVALEREGYDVAVVPTGEEALSRFADIAPDIVLLDVRLPGIDGFEVCRQLRRETRAPVLFLTARADEVDKVVGLEIGADDYLVKPFSVRELVSRVKALLRRAYGELADTQTGRTLRRGDLVIDLERRRVTRDGERIGLTTTEFDLLRHLASRPGRVYTRGQLLELVRDYEALEADERTINVHISHIRDKIEPDPAQPRYIKTVRGVGYAFSED